jgi:hypothetical protein
MVALWVLVGAGFLVSFAGMLTIGVFTMPIVTAGAVLLLVHLDRMRGWAIMLWVVAAAPLPIVWFNKDGPGRVCRRFPPDPAVFCGEQLNPWPWVAASALAFVAGAVLFILASHRETGRHQEVMTSRSSH